MQNRLEIRAKIRTYKDKQTGEDKHVYATIGTAWADEDGGGTISLDMIPLNWDGKAWMNLPKEQDRPLKQHEVIEKANEINLDEPVSLDQIPF